MCFKVSSCLFCVKLDTATKIIGIFYTITSVLSMVLFGVPLMMGSLPQERAAFYAGMVVCALFLFISSCLLIHAAIWNKPKLMWPWIVTSWSKSVTLGLLCIIGMVTLAYRATDIDSAATESCIISFYFVHSLLLYSCCSVVNSRRLELQEHTEASERLIYLHVNTPRSSNSTHDTGLA